MALVDDRVLDVRPEAIPAELRDRAQWVVWKIEAREDAGGAVKLTKVPCDPRTGAAASVLDRSQWSLLPEALRTLREGGFDGIGFVFTDSDPFTGIDLDKCRDARSGVIEPWARAIIEELNSYTEISPSGTGVHVIVRASLPPGRRRKGRIEMYDTARFFCVTGEHLRGTSESVEDRQAALNTLHATTFAPVEPESKAAKSDLATTQPATLDDATLLDRARRVANGALFAQLYDRGQWQGSYDSQSEADLALCSSLAFWTNRDTARMDRLFRGSALSRPKWDERHGEQTYGAITIARALEGTRGGYDPEFRAPTATQQGGATRQPGSTEAPPEPPADDFIKASRTYRELMSDQTPEPPSLLGNGMLRPRQIGQIHGPDGSRKSWESAHLLIDMAVGRPHWGLETKPGGARCGFVSLEDEIWVIRERLAAIALTTDADESLLEAHLRVVYPPVFDRALDITNPRDREQVKQWVRNECLQLVVIDHLSRAHSLPDERDLRPVSSAAIEIARECECAVILVHHDRKSMPGRNRGDDSGASRGDSRFSADCRLKIAMMEKGDRIRLLVEKSTRRRKPDPIWLKQHPEGGMLELAEAPAERAELIAEAAARRRQMDQLIQAAGPEGISPGALAQALSVTEKTIKSYARKNRMIQVTGKAQATRYSFPATFQVVDPVRKEPDASGHPSGPEVTT